MLGNSRITAFVATTNAERARAFYEKLGLTFIKDDGFALVFDGNGTMLRVAKAQSFTPAPFTVLGWEVVDIDKTLKAMTQAGIDVARYPFLPQDERGVCTFETGDQVAWFKDPDGNTLSVHQAPDSKSEG